MMPRRPLDITLDRQRQDGVAPLAFLPGQDLLCSGQSNASRQQTLTVIHQERVRCAKEYAAARRKLRGHQN